MMLEVSVHIEEWPTKIPFRITGLSLNAFRTVAVEISDSVHVGRGEGLPIHYLGESAATMLRQIEAARPDIERGIDRHRLLDLMPAGGARNAVDCALWDLEAKRSGKSIWDLTGLSPAPLTTVFTIGIEDTPALMAQRALEAATFSRLKIKVDEVEPFERIQAIRMARPDAELVVDANQAWTFDQLRVVAPKLAELNVLLIEQPLPRGKDGELENYASPVPLSADESCQHRGELSAAAKRYEIINIKLDKAGGLTEALLLAEQVKACGCDLLVSNMGGTSLSTAPAYVLAQICRFVELDGHLLLRSDRLNGFDRAGATISDLDPRLWG